MSVQKSNDNELSQQKLVVRKSLIPAAGKGLFTKKAIKKGTKIVEYTGKITTWEEADHDDGRNQYIYYINRNHVIDAKRHKKALARYANDARGIQKSKGLTNNASYTEEKKKVYITASRNIEAGAEIFVNYGKEYWKVIAKNTKDAG